MQGSTHPSVRRKSVFFTLGGIALIAALLLSGLPAAYAKTGVEIAGSSFKSTFTSNTAGWAVVDGDWKKTGSGYYQGDSPGFLVFASVVHNDTYNHFSLTARVKRTTGTEANMVYVRGNPTPLDLFSTWDDGYAFEWNNSGSYRVFKNVNGTDTVLQDWTATSAVIPFGWNVVRVDMTGTYMAFFINNQLVYAGSDGSLSNGQLGLGFSSLTGDDKFNIDYVKVKVITP